MATYADYAAERERAERRQRQDTFLAAQQDSFDGETRANTDKRGGWKVMKYERSSFTVVTSSKTYREGWDRIFNAPRESDCSLDSNRSLSGKEATLEPDHLLRDD